MRPARRECRKDAAAGGVLASGSWEADVMTKTASTVARRGTALAALAMAMLLVASAAADPPRNPSGGARGGSAPVARQARDGGGRGGGPAVSPARPSAP